MKRTFAGGTTSRTYWCWKTHVTSIFAANSYLKGVRMDDADDKEKERLPVYIIIGANDFVKICTREHLREGHHGDPVSESTQSDWAINLPHQALACNKAETMKQ